MIKNLILLLVIYLVYRAVKRWMLEQQSLQNSDHSVDRQNDGSDVMIKDPQCGVYFPQRQGFPLTVKGQALYFCSEQCRDDYKKTM